YEVLKVDRVEEAAQDLWERDRRCEAAGRGLPVPKGDWRGEGGQRNAGVGEVTAPRLVEIPAPPTAPPPFHSTIISRLHLLAFTTTSGALHHTTDIATNRVTSRSCPQPAVLDGVQTVACASQTLSLSFSTDDPTVRYEHRIEAIGRLHTEPGPTDT
ncbi:unnamed protein product, partial [Gadus morhua 'NCC']